MMRCHKTGLQKARRLHTLMTLATASLRAASSHSTLCSAGTRCAASSCSWVGDTLFASACRARGFGDTAAAVGATGGLSRMLRYTIGPSSAGFWAEGTAYAALWRPHGLTTV